MAYNTLVDLMKPGNPGNVRLGAAKYLMDAAGHGAKPESAKEKSLQDMSADELAETIARLDQALAGKADAAQPGVNGRAPVGAMSEHGLQTMRHAKAREARLFGAKTAEKVEEVGDGA